MKISTYKLAAKRIINENFWRCIAIAFFILFPRILFIVSSVVLIVIRNIIGFSMMYTGLFLFVAFAILFLIEVFSVSAGELMLWSIAQNYTRISGEGTADDADSDPLTFIDTFRVLGQFGISNLFRLRMRIALGLAKDIFIAVIPPLLLTCTVMYFIFSAALPVSAFAILVLGVVSIFILALYQITLEYDKYRFVYKSIGEKYTKRAKLSMADTVEIGEIPSDVVLVRKNDLHSNRYFVSEVLEDSKKFADKNILGLRKGEKSFFVKSMFLVFLGPLNIFLPILLLYGMPYKKLTMHLIAQAGAHEARKTAHENMRDQDTVIFSLKSEA